MRAVTSILVTVMVCVLHCHIVRAFPLVEEGDSDDLDWITEGLYRVNQAPHKPRTPSVGKWPEFGDGWLGRSPVPVQWMDGEGTTKQQDEQPSILRPSWSWERQAPRGSWTGRDPISSAWIHAGGTVGDSSSKPGRGRAQDSFPPIPNLPPPPEDGDVVGDVKVLAQSGDDEGERGGSGLPRIPPFPELPGWTEMTHDEPESREKCSHSLERQNVEKDAQRKREGHE